MIQIFPQLALQAEVTSLTAYFDDDKWIFQQKLDGHRVLLKSDDPALPPQAITRNGTHYTRTLPQVIQDFRFPPGEWVLDGELVGKDFWVFDMPVSPATKPSDPLWARQTALSTLLDLIPHPFRKAPTAITRAEKVHLADIALRQDFEGLVLKDRHSPYRSAGRTAEWLKVKFTTTVDVVVSDVRQNGKDAVGYFVYDANGKERDLGRASLIGKEKFGQINKGDVIEVKYLYVGANGRLYQPTILKKRTDKRPDECTDQQLRYVNKEVLATL